MKKSLALMLALLMALALVTGCAPVQTDQPGGTGTAATAVPQVQEDTPSALTYADTIAWDTEYDVVVVGFGGAGAVSAISASEAGAKVLLTEKAPEGHEGGNTRYCAQAILNFGTYEDGVAYMTAACEGIDHMTPKWIDYIVRGCMDNPAWLESVGIPAPSRKVVGNEYPELPGKDKVYMTFIADDRYASGKAYWENVRAGVVSRADNIDVWFESPAQHLIQDPVTGTILGVQIEREGKALSVRARNGVVLACGGYENNEEMVENYTQRERMYPLGSTYNTGDGIKMALEAGADIWHMAALSGPWITVKTEDSDRAFFNSMYQQITNNGACIYVGKDGTRFMPESGWHRHGHSAYSGNFYSQITPDPMYAIFDQSALESGFTGGMSFSEGLEEEIASGLAVKADTIEELEQKLGMGEGFYEFENADGYLSFSLAYRDTGLVSQVERYNGYCAEGYDHQFDRDPATMAPIAQGPFYAMELQPAMVNTQGGPKRNFNSEVLDPNGDPIPHLYSAGELGSCYGGYYTGGGNIAETMFSGRAAGTNAAAPKEELMPLTFTAVASNLQQFGTDIGKGTDIELGENEYLGEGVGLGGKLVVKVTYADGKIQAIELVSHSETEGISDPAIEQIPGAIVAAGSTQVDVASGATLTSRGIIQAVNDALSKAS